jgi:fluoride ion exporter CrcB/FEX
VAAVALGATLGSVTRFAMIALWSESTPLFVSTQLSTACACFLLGVLAVGGRDGEIRGIVTGFAGSASSLGLLTLIAISASPLMCVCYVLCTPASAAIALTLGMHRGLAWRERSAAVVVAD